MSLARSQSRGTDRHHDHHSCAPDDYPASGHQIGRRVLTHNRKEAPPMPDPVTFVNIIDVDPSRQRELIELLAEGTAYCAG